MRFEVSLACACHTVFALLALTLVALLITGYLIYRLIAWMERRKQEREWRERDRSLPRAKVRSLRG